jgi:sulfotransferase
MGKQFFFLGGLSRTGSTLLTSVLYQNPLIHTEGTSGLCNLMWQMQDAFTGDAIDATYRRDHTEHMMRQIPDMYYSNVERPVVIDKCRAWNLTANMQMIRRYITAEPKVIVMERPIDEIETSFAKLFEKNNRHDFNTNGYRQELDRNYLGVLQAHDDPNQQQYHFVQYHDLITEPQMVLDRIYEFINMPYYQHDFANIVNQNPENDLIHGLIGMHDIRSSIQIK